MRLMDTRNGKVLLFLSIFIFILSFSSLAKNGDFYYTQGIIAFNAGDYPTAEKYLKTALMLDPGLENNSDIKYMIGLSAWYAGDMVTARAYLPSDHISMLASSTKSSRRNLVADIARWESLSSEIIKLEGQPKKKKVSKAMEWLIFFSIFTSIMGSFFAYKYFKHKKGRIRLPFTEEQEELEDLPPEFSADISTSSVSLPFEKAEMPSDAPKEDEIKMKLQNLLKEDFETVETVQKIEEPEKIIEQVGSDASQEEIEKVEEAIHELLSNETEKSVT